MSTKSSKANAKRPGQAIGNPAQGHDRWIERKS
eukprot:CAMPEP_0204421698 /NCGR_PEP_ID=MMETSP0470-20130426/35060_1 /ASSEMBLY_ACC=CAM_ASM_000385 /TAXON_ID=2969 /ORGANISM="Oxyrrhis marina" /LENGTH=32 /DNA_ID= /DNA_START= /DNA_END= /DNA_ORIENTATION=